MRLGIAEALRKAIHGEMANDENVFCIGEDIGIPGGYGGAFTVTLGLEKDFRERIIETPRKSASSPSGASSTPPSQRSVYSVRPVVLRSWVCVP